MAQVAASAPSGCTYRSCAVRVEPVFLGVALKRGASGETIAKLGGFGSGVDVLLAGPDSASKYAHSFVYATRRATAFGLIGALAYGITAGRTGNFRDSADGVDVALIATGVSAMIASIPYSIRSQRSLSRAVWWYNEALPR